MSKIAALEETHKILVRLSQLIPIVFFLGATWGPGQIAAVVLGVLLLIVIIILSVYLIRKMIKKKKNFSLATYRGSGGTTGNYE